MCILSFLLNVRHKSPLLLKKKIRLGDEIGINIIFKSSNGQIHRFFDCLGIRSTIVSLKLKFRKIWHSSATLPPVLVIFCLMPKRQKLSLHDINSIADTFNEDRDFFLSLIFFSSHLWNKSSARHRVLVLALFKFIVIPLHAKKFRNDLLGKLHFRSYIKQLGHVS